MPLERGSLLVEAVDVVILSAIEDDGREDYRVVLVFFRFVGPCRTVLVSFDRKLLVEVVIRFWGLLYAPYNANQTVNC